MKLFLLKIIQNVFCVHKSCKRRQSDQMVIFYFQYLSIDNNENVPNSIEKFPKEAQRFAKY